MKQPIHHLAFLALGALLLAAFQPLAAQNLKAPVAGVYVWQEDDPQGFLDKTYKYAVEIHLFADGHYARLRIGRNPANPVDLKIEPLGHGRWESSGDLCFLLPEGNPEFLTFRIEPKGLRGSLSQSLFSLRETKPL